LDVSSKEEISYNVKWEGEAGIFIPSPLVVAHQEGPQEHGTG